MRLLQSMLPCLMLSIGLSGAVFGQLGTTSGERIVAASRFMQEDLPQVPDLGFQPEAASRLSLTVAQQTSPTQAPEQPSGLTSPQKDVGKLKDSQLDSVKVEGSKVGTDSKSEKKDAKSSDKKEDKKDDKDAEKKKKKEWYEKLAIRGYVQFRYNYPTFTEDGSAPRQHQADASISDRQEFFIRRARLIFFGDISEHMYVYIQPDLASTPNGSVDQIQFAQIRDCYSDIYVDKTKIHRFRVGQSKIPYGWENMQSSSNRLPLDRTDAINTAARNERDLGVFYYYDPKWGQDIFKFISDEGLKGSGDYGIFGLGVYNGQGGSLREQSDSLHVISRLTVPFFVDKQLYEVSMQGYTGDVVVLGERIQPRGVGPTSVPVLTRDVGGSRGLLDERLAWTYVKYAQPLGFQAEYNVGRGPRLNAAQTALEVDTIHGGYMMCMYRYKSDCHGEFWPFVRYHYYRGGYKTAANAPYSQIDEWNFGVEWQIKKEFELATEYMITDRTNLNSLSAGQSYRQYNGHVLRFQFQFNF